MSSDCCCLYYEPRLRVVPMAACAAPQHECICYSASGFNHYLLTLGPNLFYPAVCRAAEHECVCLDFDVRLCRQASHRKCPCVLGRTSLSWIECWFYFGDRGHKKTYVAPITVVSSIFMQHGQRAAAFVFYDRLTDFYFP